MGQICATNVEGIDICLCLLQFIFSFIYFFAFPFLEILGLEN